MLQDIENCIRIATYHMKKAQEYLDKAKALKSLSD